MTAIELDDLVRDLDAGAGPADSGWETVVVVAHADPAARSELGRHLARRGFRVFAAGTAAEALWEALAHAGSVDALVCDARLPGLPVVELYRRLKLTVPWLRLCVLAPEPAGLAVS